MDKTEFYDLIQNELNQLAPPQLVNSTEVTDLPKATIMRVGRSTFYQDRQFVCRAFNKHISRVIKI